MLVPDLSEIMDWIISWLLLEILMEPEIITLTLIGINDSASTSFHSDILIWTCWIVTVYYTRKAAPEPLLEEKRCSVRKKWN